MCSAHWSICSSPRLAHLPWPVNQIPSKASSYSVIWIILEFFVLQNSVWAEQLVMMTSFPHAIISKASRFHPSALDGNTPQSTLLITSATSLWFFTLSKKKIRSPILEVLYRRIHSWCSLSERKGLWFIIHSSTLSDASKARLNARTNISWPFLTSHFPILINLVVSHGSGFVG